MAPLGQLNVKGKDGGIPAQEAVEGSEMTILEVDAVGGGDLGGREVRTPISRVVRSN
jgi:hypothetical protein